MSEHYIGVMSGTSLDGIDVAYCKIEGDDFELIEAKEYPYDKELKKDVLAAIEGKTTLKNIGRLHVRLGRMYAEAIENFIKEHDIDRKAVKAIGLHGQTLWHEPDGDYPFSMQLGDANAITALTGVSVVSDFRSKDIALGGQGAPFAPVFHDYMFSKYKPAAVVNIGGMANITVLDEVLKGYDTGCGNALMDHWIQKCKDLPYDKDGEWAKSGSIDKGLLNKMLLEPYFEMPSPKSTGRELFNKEWLAKKLEGFSHVKNEDVQATLAELTALSIAREAQKYSIDILILCGGGAKNSYMVQRIKENLTGTKVVLSDDMGVSGDFMEAMAFAWLAYQRVHRKHVKLSVITGASKDSILGAIYE